MNNLKGKKLLITGSTGFIGANLVRNALKADAEVHIITRPISNNWRIRDIFEDICCYPIDLLDLNALELVISKIKPDLIYHTASYGGNPIQKDLKKIIESNFIATTNVVNSCKKVGFELFVNTGSSSEYGTKTTRMSEDNLLEPVNNYGILKAATTLYCQAIAKNEDLPIVTLRLFSPYGCFEDSSRLIPSVILSCLRGKNPVIATTTSVRDFIFIDDVVNAYRKLSYASDVSGRIFNIGYGEQHSVWEIVNKIIDLTGSKVVSEIKGAPKWPNEPAKWEADISRAIDLLGWRPKYNLEQGLTTSIRWFENNIQLYGC